MSESRHPLVSPSPPHGAGRESVRRYRLALGVALIGLGATALAGWGTHRWASERDAERFAAESRMLHKSIEQKMERYESALARLGDVCARSEGEVSATDWSGWLGILQIPVNQPAVRCLLVAPRVLPRGREAFLERAVKENPRHSASFLNLRADAAHWAPVWRRFVRDEVEAPETGEDLLVAGTRHPALEPALRSAFGWVSGAASLRDPSGGERPGFWFVVPLHPAAFTNYIRWQRPDESVPAAVRRRGNQRLARSTGLLAAFFEGDRFLEEYNPDGQPQLAMVQLYAGSEPGPATLLNPGHPPPVRPMLTRDQSMRWYGRSWTLRCHSTPVFEAGMLGYRTWLVLGAGGILSVGMGAVLAWQVRGRLREAALAAQLRQALSRQERLSRDLHDGTLQSVYALGLGLQRATKLLRTHPDSAAVQLQGTAQALQQVVGELRAFIRDSDPAVREESRLGEALAGVVEHLRMATDMELNLECGADADVGLDPAQALDWLNIAREALSNAVRHSRGHRVNIRLDRRAGRLRLEVADDGLGFDPVAASESGRGLRNLAVRVRDLGGELQCDAAPGRGTRIIVEGAAGAPDGAPPKPQP